jgi:hypothetical protein
MCSLTFLKHFTKFSAKMHCRYLLQAITSLSKIWENYPVNLLAILLRYMQ